MPLVRRSTSPYWYVQFRHAGRTVVRSTKTVDRKAAEKFETRLRAEAYAKGTLAQLGQTTLIAAIDRLVETKVGTANHRNLLNHRTAIASTLGGRMMISSLRSADLERHKKARLAAGRAAQTVKHELDLIMQAIRLAGQNGFEVPTVRAPRVRIPNARLRYLTLNEEHRLLVELDPSKVSTANARIRQSRQDGYDLVLLLLDTGARYNEIASLEWSQIDLNAGTIRLWRSKVENESVLFMSERVTKLIANRLIHRSGKFVFSNSVGGARGYRVAGLRAAFDRAGLHDCSLHTLRHTHASRLVQHGMSLYEVRVVLGHSDVRTTMRYAHLEQADVTSRARDLIDGLNKA